MAALSAKTRGQAIELARERPQYAANIAYNLAVLAEIVRLGRAKGYAVAFFQQPLGLEANGPGWQSLPGRLPPRRRRRCAHLRRARHRRAAPSAGCSENDFADLFHLVNSGRDKWTPPFARDLAAVLRSAGGSG